MMSPFDSRTQIFQTLECRNNKEYVEEEGPFCCKRSDAWLGHGYYFWDSSIKNAHTWGRGYRNKGKHYYITSAKCDLSSNCFNLLEPKFKQSFEVAVRILCEKYDKKPTDFFVLDVINKLMELDGFKEKFFAIKVQSDLDLTANSSSKNQKFSFSLTSDAYFDASSYVQICIFEASINEIDIQEYGIVYDSSKAIKNNSKKTPFHKVCK